MWSLVLLVVMACKHLFLGLAWDCSLHKCIEHSVYVVIMLMVQIINLLWEGLGVPSCNGVIGTGQC